MSAIASSNWKTEEQIRQSEFRAGYEQEAAPGVLRPDERSDGSDKKLAYTHVEGAECETTLYATKEPLDWYDSTDPLPESGRYNTRGEKYTRLWELNAGRDDHTAAGKTYKDDEIHKVNQPARDRARFVHAVASVVELPRRVVDRCTSLARQLDPRAFNHWGGMDVFILAVVEYAAQEADWSVDSDAFHSIREQWDVGVDELSSAIEKVEEKIHNRN